MHPQRIVPIDGKGKDYITVDSEWENETIVVVGVLSNEIHPTR
jgi:hypothetical protein